MYDLETRIKRFLEKQADRLEGKASSVPSYMTTWTQVRTNQHYDLSRLTDEGYRKNSIASACIIMIATSAPEAELKVYQPSEMGHVEVPDHWLKQLINRPNPYLSTYELWELVHTYLNTSGNAYILLHRDKNAQFGPVTELDVLRPDMVVPAFDENNKIRYYQYSLNGKQFKFLPHQIIHLKFPDPLNEVEGLSPLARVLRELNIDNQATDFTRTFFNNAAVPYGILSTDQKMREEEVERTRERWMDWFRGSRGKNRFKPAVLGQGLKYEQIGLSFQEMEFEALRSMTETRICGAFGVDPVLLPSWVGIKYGGKYSNYSEARRHLWDETIIPALRRIESKLTSQLLAHEGVVARFDLSKIQALQENVNAKFERIQGAFTAGIMKLDEARTQLGLEQDELLGDLYTFQLKGQQGKSVKTLK
jgi:HK97 family phage portal protein